MTDLHTRDIYRTLDGQISDPTITVNDTVIDSWRRCRDHYGLSPDVKVRPSVLTKTELQQVRDPLEDLVLAASPEIERLFSILPENHYVVTLTAAEGAMLDFMASASLLSTCKEFGFHHGSIWKEELHGTNGTGTCLKTHTPVTVMKDEHFSNRYTGLTCSVAPIFNNDSSLAAVLNVTTPSKTNHQTQQLVRKIVQLSAKRIQHNMFRRKYRKNTILRLSHFSDFMDVTTEGLVAVDTDDTIVASENCGNQNSDLNNFNIMLGQPITDILGNSCSHLHKESPDSLALQLQSSKRLSNDLFVKFYDPPAFKKLGQQEISLPGRSNSTRTSQEFSKELRSVIGHDPKMIRNTEIALKVTKLRLPILLLGETGTGKGAFAKAIHDSGPRKNNPFVAVNCAAIPETLIESELFGYRAGAFTGADKKGYKGKILEANGGTLFLDEIGDMPTALQTRLLRVLSEGEIIPLGGDKRIQLDIHVISATLKNLSDLVSDGSFREDLYFRLNGASLQLPALRERTDIQDIVSNIVDRECQSHKLSIQVSDSLLSYIDNYFWQGNIRELINAIKYCIAMCDGEVIEKHHLPPQIQTVASHTELEESVNIEEKEITCLALQRESWNVSAAARVLGISRATMHRRIKQYGLSRS